ncbi:MAG: hypothetical protein Q9206_006648, partial [Seirophora lacunosa]
MSPIEELSNESQADPEPLTNTSPETPFPIRPKPKDQDASTTPSLPSAMDSVRSYSADEIVQMMKKTPLFMTNLEDGGNDDDNEENIQLEALRALQYEGTRREIALGFKERGNEMVAEKRWKDAKEFYTKGILTLKAPQKEVVGDKSASADEEAEEAEEKKVEEACYINRALCNLELQNYRSTLHDTRHTLLLTPTSHKALYRSALALLHLSRHAPALDATTRGLALTSPSPEEPPSAPHTAFLTLHERILSAQRLAAISAAKRASAAEHKRKEQLALTAALQARGIKLRVSERPPDLEDAVLSLRPDPESPTSALHFPVLLLYPEAGGSDFVKQVAETERWGDVLALVLGGGGGPGEGEGVEYTPEGVESFAKTREGGLVKVGRK